MIVDGDAMGIAAQICDHLAGAAEWGPGINHPFTLAERRRQSPKGLGLDEFGKCAVKRQPPGVERLLKGFQKQAAEEA